MAIFRKTNPKKAQNACKLLILIQENKKLPRGMNRIASKAGHKMNRIKVTQKQIAALVNVFGVKIPTL